MTTSSQTEAEHTGEPHGGVESADSDRLRVSKWFVFGVIAAPTLLIFLTISGLLGQLIGDGNSLWRVPPLFEAVTPTGADLGAHVLLPKILMEDLLSSGRVLGWSMDWFAGFPVMYFYFPLPALVTVLLDLVLPYGVAFKLVVVAGLLGLPTVSYFFVKHFGFSKFVAAIAGVAGSLFVFMESYSILGANITSTLVGEFSYGWSFTLSILYVGLVVRNWRNDKVFDPWAGVVLGLTAMSHVITTIVVVVATLPLLLAPVGRYFGDRRDRPWPIRRSIGVLWTYIIGFGLSAFWSIPLGVNVLTGMTTDMGWVQVTAVIGGNGGIGSPLPAEFIPALILGIVGIVWTLSRRDRVGLLVWMTLFPLVGYFLIVTLDLTIFYNARLLPYWFFGMYIFAGITIGLAANTLAVKYRHVVRKSLVAIVAIVAMLGFVAVSMEDIPSWVKWSFEGYEGKQTWAEYENLMHAVDELPDGRIVWEVNDAIEDYGSSTALTLFPFWSEGHPSMSGLFYESSLTTPFDFLNSSDVSDDPVISTKALTHLNYGEMDFDRGTKHLELYDVGYYLSYTESATHAALAFGLAPVAESGPWTIFALPDTNRVDVAAYEPVVWAGEADFVDAALEWYDDVDHLDMWLVEDGPAEWRRVTTVDERLETPIAYAEGATATLTMFEDHAVSFTTDAVGRPHLVKVSYFPNWTLTGGEGVYRAAPSLMVVVPDTKNVTLVFTNRWVEHLGIAITVVTVVGLAGFAIVLARRRRKPAI